MTRAFTLLLGAMLSSQAFALDQCNPTADDAQVRICAYSPTQRYKVNGVVGFPIDLRFGDTERIKRADFAFTGLDKDGKPTSTWMAPKCGKDDQKCVADRFQNNLPIWPLQEGHSAVIVVTAIDGAERLYQLDLHATTAPTDNSTATLSFTYPADEAKAANQAAEAKKQAAIAAWQARQTKVKEDTAIARLKTDVFYGERNWRYQAKADPAFKALAPSEVSDNGWLTEMQWPGNVQLPTITILDPASGEERVAPVSQQGQMQIINTTAEWFRLRLGPKAVMDIHNLAWSATRPDPGTGTTSPDALRRLIFNDAAK